MSVCKGRVSVAMIDVERFRNAAGAAGCKVGSSAGPRRESMRRPTCRTSSDKLRCVSLPANKVNTTTPFVQAAVRAA
jgi:hypothetical protein